MTYLRMNGTKIGILKETYQVRLTCLLESSDGSGLESKVGLEVLGNLSHQPLKGEFPNQEFGALLVLTNLT